VARRGAFEPDLAESFRAAWRTPGFALVELWELCTAYFVPANHVNRGSLEELSEKTNLPFGVLHEDSTRKRQPGRVGIERRQSPADRNGPGDERPLLKMTSRIGISIAGSAGQRIRSATRTLGEIAVAGGLFAAQQDDYPITVRKGFSVSNLIISPDPIHYAGVEDPDLLLVLSVDGLERMRERLIALSASHTLAVQSDLSLPMLRARVVPLDLDLCQKGAGKASAALAALASATVRAGFFEAGELLAVADATLSGGFRDANISALRVGFDVADQRPWDARPIQEGEVQ
jgi:Pyruvate/2-oxoacid:ferredoxin oxidoreductase gamma subunit